MQVLKRFADMKKSHPVANVSCPKQKKKKTEKKPTTTKVILSLYHSMATLIKYCNPSILWMTFPYITLNFSASQSGRESIYANIYQYFPF